MNPVKVGVEYETPPAIGFKTLPVLPYLAGRPWDEIALAYVHSLRPSWIRVTTGEVYCDAKTWRVTVYVNHENIIEKIEQECQVGLPDGVRNGWDLSQHLKEEKTV